MILCKMAPECPREAVYLIRFKNPSFALPACKECAEPARGNKYVEEIAPLAPVHGSD